MQKKSGFQRILKWIKTQWNVAIFSMMFAGWLILFFVWEIIYNDITYWGKDIVSILFGSRSGENISLGIGMILFYYLVIGIFLVLLPVIFKIKKQKESQAI